MPVKGQCKYFIVYKFNVLQGQTSMRELIEIILKESIVTLMYYRIVYIEQPGAKVLIDTDLETFLMKYILKPMLDKRKITFKL